MAKAGLWTGPVKLFAPPELLFGRTQRPKNHRFHYFFIAEKGGVRRYSDDLRGICNRPSWAHHSVLDMIYQLS